MLYAQLASPDVDPDPLMTWASALPIDVLVQNPAVEYPLLYNFSKLLDKHPVRISIPVKNGFVKAVRLALALGFSVKLEVGQPDASLIAEMAEVLDLYLHRSEVSQPVEYFHSTFLSFFNHKQSSNLWFVQEEDPEQFRFITNEGAETVSPRFGEIDWKDLESILPLSENGSTLKRRSATAASSSKRAADISSGRTRNLIVKALRLCSPGSILQRKSYAMTSPHFRSCREDYQHDEKSLVCHFSSDE